MVTSFYPEVLEYTDLIKSKENLIFFSWDGINKSNVDKYCSRFNRIYEDEKLSSSEKVLKKKEIISILSHEKEYLCKWEANLDKKLERFYCPKNFFGIDIEEENVPIK
jgi:hypothetical protein